MFSTILSGTIYGLNCHIINVEVDVSNGLPCFVMVGNLSSEVRESAERVRVALKNSNITLPPMHISVNLSPAGIHKTGTLFDLPIAISLLCAMDIIDFQSVEDTLILGELGLNGEVKRISGVMPLVWEAKKQGISKCIVPFDNIKEARLIEGVSIIGTRSVNEIVKILSFSENERNSYIKDTLMADDSEIMSDAENMLDFSDICGQEGLKRGALIAAAGKHHMLIVGPPGTGKTMVAKRISGILPKLTHSEMMDVTSIYSIAGKLNKNVPVITKRPFVAPHHTASAYAISGGGTIPSPGALSLAHKGILFLDELPEFKREAIDMLREPLEEKSINITRAKASFRYPADIMLVAAMNPCPCGYYPDMNKCCCTEAMVKRYISHISGPILDRIDIAVTANKINITALQSGSTEIESKKMLEMVIAARKRQSERYKGLNIICNSELNTGLIKDYLRISGAVEKRFADICEKLDITARSYHKILRVSRTIADLDECLDVEERHLKEAICYRMQNLVV